MKIPSKLPVTAEQSRAARFQLGLAVLGALVVLAFAAAQSKKPATPGQPGQV